MAAPCEQPWKNSRKRSLYVEEGFAGFIFYRKSKKLERKDEASPAEEEDSLTQPEQLHTDSLQHTVDGVVGTEDSPLSDEQLERLVEVKCFVDQLEKEIRVKGLSTPDDKLEEMCAAMLKELRQEVISGSSAYIDFLEARDEEDKLPPHPMDDQLAESIQQLQQKVDMCERETQEWEALMETKKMEAQTTTRDLESDMGLDLSQLGPEDEEKLASHLSQERRGWLEHATSEIEDRVLERRREQDILAMSSRIRGELERVQSYCDSIAKRISEDAHQLGVTPDIQTPRTLFRGLKHTNN